MNKIPASEMVENRSSNYEVNVKYVFAKDMNYAIYCLGVGVSTYLCHVLQDAYYRAAWRLETMDYNLASPMEKEQLRKDLDTNYKAAREFLEEYKPEDKTVRDAWFQSAEERLAAAERLMQIYDELEI